MEQKNWLSGAPDRSGQTDYGRIQRQGLAENFLRVAGTILDVATMETVGPTALRYGWRNDHNRLDGLSTYGTQVASLLPALGDLVRKCLALSCHFG